MVGKEIFLNVPVGKKKFSLLLTHNLNNTTINSFIFVLAERTLLLVGSLFLRGSITTNLYLAL